MEHAIQRTAHGSMTTIQEGAAAMRALAAATRCGRCSTPKPTGKRGWRTSITRTGRARHMTGTVRCLPGDRITGTARHHYGSAPASARAG